MDFKTFKEEVKENVRAHLPKEAKDVELSFGTWSSGVVLSGSNGAVGRKIGDFTILPSSTHETLILPDSEGMPIQHLKEMVAEVNGSFVEDADRLTDEVYHFDTKDRVFEKVDKFVARQKENSQKHVAEKGTEGI
mgnify:CR=1 FL=1